MEWAIEVALEFGLPVAATMCMGPGGDESGVGSVSESTVISGVGGKSNRFGKDDESDQSDSGWDTDLEIDGGYSKFVSR